VPFNDKSVKKYLFFAGLFISLIIGCVYFLNLTTNLIFYKLPQRLDSYSFENVYLQRILDLEDREFIEMLYVTNEDNEYELRSSSISKDDRLKALQIIYSSGYYTDLQTIDRNVDTIPKQLLNGNLGIFFRFDLLGNLNWLAIPFFLILLINVKRLSRLEWFILSCYLSVLILICVTAFPNYRYQLTLLPFTVGFVVWTIQKVFDLKYILNYKNIIIGFFVFIIVINNLYFFNRYNMDSTGMEKNSYEAMSEITKIISLSGDEKVLVNNAPEFYYYTDLKGIYYTYAFGKDYYFVDGEKYLLYGHTFKEVYNLLVSYNVVYILSDESINEYFAPFKQFVKQCSDVVYDRNGYILYKLKTETTNKCS
jgi:hypothetical protein